MNKTFYYKFNKIDNCFWAMITASIFVICTHFVCPVSWGLLLITFLVWWYKDILKQPCVTITDKDIKIDHNAPLSWKDIAGFEIKDVCMCGGRMKILSLIAQKNIKYHYNWLQKHNGDFGAFAIPLYSVLSKEDEDEIIKIVKSKVAQNKPVKTKTITKKKTKK